MIRLLFQHIKSHVKDQVKNIKATKNVRVILKGIILCKSKIKFITEKSSDVERVKTNTVIMAITVSFKFKVAICIINYFIILLLAIITIFLTVY